MLFISLLLIFLRIPLEAFGSNGWNQVNLQLSYNVMEHVNLETHNTELFRHQSGLHVRHDLDFHILLKYSADQQHCNKIQPFLFKLIQNNISVHTWTQKPTVQQSPQDQDETLNFYLHVNRSIPIGQYTLNVDDPCSESTRKELLLCYVNAMFNPWSERIAKLKADQGRI